MFRREGIKKRVSAAVMVMILGCLCGSARAGLGEDVEALTGSHTRIVWVQGPQGGFNPCWDTALYRVMAFDSREPGLRELAPAAKIAWPRISPDGNKVLFSQSKQAELKLDSTVYIVDWSGKNLKVFAPGYCYDVWRDPKTGYPWAYIGDKFPATRMDRYRIDKPSVVEPIFGPEKNFSVQEFHISGDGKFAIGLFPHPRVCLMDLSTGNLGPQLADGCNLSIAPDDSHLWWVMDGGHRSVHIKRPDGSEAAHVTLHQGGEGMNGSEVWNPEWTNKRLIFTINGPYTKLHLPGSNIYIGRFNESLTQVEKYIRIVNDTDAKTNQHGWIDLNVKSGGGGSAKAATDKDSKRQSAAAALYKRMLAVEKSFQEVAGAKASAADKAWLARNGAKVSTMRGIAANLKKSYADTDAWSEAQTLLQKYEIDLEKRN